ncbi:secretin N-terminal domain-containing protein [Marinobacter sp. HL-58]|uniref:secretin N-terminal domain-containing protein n=1 Tax=Marinobacter sp. HL-58 TaxID=1479237 RepID=UPI00048744F2|nr:secretin N-terminal domain-containing protein [Marinobacter sp. HL-58]KPQ02911.1 MAG: T2aSS general secretion pathway secretin GspD [Marinobacter sp. HL-58]
MNTHKLWLTTLLAVMLLLLSGNIAAEPEARTYQMGQRSAEDVARQIRELYPDGQVSITARGQQMVVRGEPPVLDEIGMLVETMDVAPAQMRITVRSSNNADSKSGGAGVSADNNQANIKAERKVTTTRRNQERTLVVQDGQSAHITSGQVRTVPVAIRGGRNPAAFLDQVETRSGFLVSPQVISDQAVELNIVSFEEDDEGDIPGYETEALMTIRRVEPGEWVELGSTRERRAGEKSGITYQTGGDSRQNQTFEVRVEVL